MFLDNPEDLWRICAIGPLTYVLMIGLLRLSGKRTLAKMNAFDLIVTVALGSTLATILLSRDVSLADGTARAHPAHRSSVRRHLAVGALDATAGDGQVQADAVAARRGTARRRHAAPASRRQ